jgi:hypothetical protein
MQPLMIYGAILDNGKSKRTDRVPSTLMKKRLWPMNYNGDVLVTFQWEPVTDRSADWV